MTDLPIAGTVVPIVQGQVVARASDVSATGESGNRVQSALDNLGESILQWKFNSAITDASNPGATFLALNDALKDNATIVSFHVQSNVDSARFDNFLADLKRNDRIFIQERTATNTSILYRVTGPATVDGTKVNVPVIRERDQGGEFTNDEALNVSFFRASAGEAVNVNRTVTINASSSSALTTSLGSVTPALGDGFRVSTAGAPFAGLSFRLEVGDTLVIIQAGTSLTEPSTWGFLRRPAQIGANDIDPNYRQLIENGGSNSGGGAAPDLASLQQKVENLYPLTPNVADLNDWARIYNPAQAAEEVSTIPGYTSLADFRGTAADEHFESAGIIYDDTGANVVDYSGIGNDPHRVLGVKVDAPADQVLLSIIDGAEVIPFIDMTATGNFRVNNYTPARAQNEVVTNHIAEASLNAGTGTISVGGGASTYTVNDYPQPSTNQSRTTSIDVDIFVSGVDSLAGGDVHFDIPDTDVAQAKRTLSHTFNLGPLNNNRRVDVTFGYEVRISGPLTLLDITLEAAPADVTVGIEGVFIVQSYTTQVVIARVDNFQTLQDGLGDFSFTGEAELIIAFHPVINALTGQAGGLTDVVPVVRTSTATSQLNDSTIANPQPGFDEIRIPDTIEFRTFLPNHFLRHADLASLLTNQATKWVYGLALLRETSVRAITQVIDLAAGSTIDGEAISSSALVEVYRATGTGTGAGELVNQVSLPANYTDFDFVVITSRDPTGPEWRRAVVDVALLSSDDFGVGDLIRSQGSDDFSWTVATRTLVTNPLSQEIWRAVMIRY